MKTKLLAILFFCYCTVALFAQSVGTTYVVKGELLDSVSRESVIYATVSIANKENPAKAVKVLVTDMKGQFKEKLPEAGEYIVTISSIGNLTITHPFTVKKTDKTVDLGTLYTREAVESLGGVTVLAQKPLVKVDIDKIAYDVESDPDAEAKTVLDMLRKVPLVTVDGEDNIKLNGKSDFKIQLNGRPSNLLSNNPGKTLKSMPANSVKNIEVITNPGAKYDAEGVGGIINIVTLKGKSLEGYSITLDGGANLHGGYNAGANAIVKVGKLSLSGNYGYYYYRMPEVAVNSITEYYADKENHFMSMDYGSELKQPMQYGSAEASYEIDSLNLLTFTLSSYAGKQRLDGHSYIQMQNEDRIMSYAYGTYMKNRQKFGGTELSLNYQRTLSKAEELLTFSYRYSHSPAGGSNYQHIIPSEGRIPFGYAEQNTDNDAASNEHTVQLDYVNPFNRVHTLEAGLKYIYRSNSSFSTYEQKITENDQWMPVPMEMNDFDHNQYILSAYAAYALNYKFFGLKLGARMEQSKLNAKLHSDNIPDFKSKFADVVPTANLSFKLSDSKTLRAGYNLRISRPDISYLNPYKDEKDPHYVSFGNPYLDSEKYHNVNLNFSSFTQKLMINLSASYDFCNNSIEQYTLLNKTTGKIETTYENIGRRQSVALAPYVNATLFDGTNLWMNGSVSYTDLRSSNLQLVDSKAKGWQWGAMLGVQQRLPLKIQLSAYGGYYSAAVRLQGTGTNYYFYGLSLNRSFLKDDRLTATFYTQNFMNKFMTYTMTSYTKDYHMVSKNKNQQQMFGLSLSFRIGDLRTVVKKVARGIVNDDLKGGDDGAKNRQKGK